MHEYIKRTDAIAEINRGDLLVGNNAEWAREIIWRTPYADVVEVKHGYWKPNWCDAYCSVCNYLNKADGFLGKRKDYPYCPNCGSRMDGEKWYE